MRTVPSASIYAFYSTQNEAHSNQEKHDVSPSALHHANRGPTVLTIFGVLNPNNVVSMTSDSPIGEHQGVR